MQAITFIIVTILLFHQPKILINKYFHKCQLMISPFPHGILQCLLVPFSLISRFEIPLYCRVSWELNENIFQFKGHTLPSVKNNLTCRLCIHDGKFSAKQGNCVTCREQDVKTNIHRKLLEEFSFLE